MQRGIIQLLAKILGSRTRVGNFPTDDASLSDLVTMSGNLIGNISDMTTGSVPKTTIGLRGRKQIVPNFILILLSCFLALLAFVKALLSESDASLLGEMSPSFLRPLGGIGHPLLQEFLPTLVSSPPSPYSVVAD